MHLRIIFNIFALAVLFLLYGVSEGQWLDYLCQKKEDVERNYNDSVLILLPKVFKSDKELWEHQKLCLYNKGHIDKCMEIGQLNGTKYPKKLRIERDTSSDVFVEGTYRASRDVSSKVLFQDTFKGHGASKRGVSADLPSDYFYGEATCRVATKLKTAEVLCKIFPSSIKCKSHCVYGTTFEEGIQRLHSCVYKENRWSKDFEECRPFVDCNLKLISPGNIKCIGNEVMKKPRCQVQCEEYEDKSEIKSQTYTCLANGKWQPPLPHCVVPRGIDLVKAPSVVEHKALTYP